MPSIVYAQYNVTVYNSTNGYPHDLSYQILQDTDEVLWIGTDVGLVRYNGTDFKTYSIADGLRNDYVIDVEKLNRGCKIIATWGGGLHVLDKYDEIKPLMSNDSLYKVQKVYDFGEDFVAKVIAGSFKFYKKKSEGYDVMSFQAYSEKNKPVIYKYTEVVGSQIQHSELVSLELDYKKIDDRLFFYNEYLSDSKVIKGLFELCDNLKFETAYPFLNDYEIFDLGRLDNGMFYGVTSNSVLFFSEERLIEEKHFFKQQKGRLIKFFKKSNVEVYVQKTVEGHHKIYVYDIYDNNWFLLPERYLQKSLISDILIDKDGNIWISSYGNGLIKVAKKSRLPIVKSIPWKNCLDFIDATPNGYFLLEQYSINYLNNELDTIQRLKIPNNSGFSTSNSNKIFLMGNISHFKAFDFMGKKLSFDHRFRVYEKNRDSVFFTEGHLLLKRHREEKMHTIIAHDEGSKFKNIDIEDVLIYDDKIWCASNMGLQIYDLQTLKLERHVTTENGLTSNYIEKLSPSKDEVWIAAINGLHKYEFEKDKITVLDMGSTHQSNQINSIVCDDFDQLWIGTQKGLVLYKGAVFYNFYQDNGLSSSFTSKIFEDKKNRMWLFGNRGVDILANNKPYEPESSPILKVLQEGSRFEIEYVDYSKFSKVTQFKINDQGWRAFQDPKLNFNNYKYGKYQIQFRIRKLNSDWRYSKKFHFVIHRPWYIKWYMILSYVILVLTVVSTFVILYLKRLKKRNTVLRATIEHSKSLQEELDNVRENVAQDFHDELGNKLAGITVLSDRVLDRSLDENSKMFKDLSRINKDAKSLYYGIKDFIWSIDSKHDDLEELMMYLKDFGENLFANTDVQFFVNPNFDRIPVKLPYYWSRHLLLIFKEAMTNIFKHSNASRVDFDFDLKNDRLRIVIKDDGVGFCMDSMSRKNGLSNMAKRAFSIGGTLMITSNQGTQIVFETLLTQK
ncbi:two-component regulator propeller domain-containing protein [Aquimarina sp. 2201CG1-2-11]|uniref:sensor histidine kinase n=1 Tax=Aquimarina discodermiae TaxID=3231043 RepID=UPI003461FA9C